MDPQVVSIRFRPPGPVCARFIAERSSLKCIMGPMGSGKTVGCLFNLVQLACLQRPSPRDGVRYSRWAVIRDTYRQIQMNVLPSWHAWFPQSVGEWRAKEPPSHTVTIDLGEGKPPVHMEMIFIAVNEHNDIERIAKGLELTGAYMNEADTLDEDVFPWFDGRTGRYPGTVDGGASWSGTIMDCNGLSVDSWVYRQFVEDPTLGSRFYRQPGGREPEAENLENLPKGYYDRLAQNNRHRPWWVRRNVDNLFGARRDGKPVYELEFNELVHVSRGELEYLPSQVIHIGADAGRQPAAVLLQRDAWGQIRALRELVIGGAGATVFGRRLADFLHENFPEAECVGWGDPSGADPTESSEVSWLEIMEEITGFPWMPAPFPGNNSVMRREALAVELTTMIEGRPMFLIDPRCKMLRRGLNDGYRYLRIKGASDRYSETIDKNEYSHVVEGCQYGVGGISSYGDVERHRGHKAAVPMQTKAQNAAR